MKKQIVIELIDELIDKYQRALDGDRDTISRMGMADHCPFCLHFGEYDDDEVRCPKCVNRLSRNKVVRGCLNAGAVTFYSGDGPLNEQQKQDATLRMEILEEWRNRLDIVWVDDLSIDDIIQIHTNSYNHVIKGGL